MQQGASEGAVDRIERVLHALWVRVLLSLLILASLLPHPQDHLTDLVFFGVFALELALRTAVFMRGARAADDDIRTTRRRALIGLALALDFLALLTFLPWASMTGLVEARWLRLLRLLRMLLLIGFWAPILRDMWTVLTRHDRMRQVSLLGLMVALLAFAGATVLSHIPVEGTDFNGDTRLDTDDQHFWPRLWWAFRQVQDPGNMVTDPGEIAVVVVSLLLTVAGLFVVSFLIGLATDIVRELVSLAQNRPIGWKGHTVLVHAPPGLARLLSELTGYYQKLFRTPRFVVADQAREPPAALRAGDLARVRWRTIDVRGEDLVPLTDVRSARRVVVLAKPEAPFPDAHVAATVLDVREANAKAWVVVEVLDPNNIAAARVAGGGRTVVVASEKVLGIWALAAIRRPEQIPVAWELLATRGGSEIYTCYFDADGLAGPGTAWLPPACRFVELGAGVMRAPRVPGERREGLRRRASIVVPLGVVYAEPGHSGGAHDHGDLALAPGQLEARPVRAIVAIADHFVDLERASLRLHAGEIAPSAGAGAADAGPALGPQTLATRVTRVLVCGFRPATVVVCAGLLSDRVATEITLVMRHEESVRQAAQAFREHGLGVARGRCFAGRFDSAADASGRERFVWVPHGEAAAPGGVTLVQADWTSERTLLGLEPGVDHVGTHDLVVLMGAHLPEYDGRNAITCLKIADLARGSRERFREDQRVLVGISDAELGRRLVESFARATRHGGPKLSLMPTEDLRVQFVFQSIAVPGWEAIFLELLGPGGAGLVRRPVVAGEHEHGPAGADERCWRFADLALALEAHGLLVAVEDHRGARRYGPGDDEGWRTSEIAALWFIAPE